MSEITLQLRPFSQDLIESNLPLEKDKLHDKDYQSQQNPSRKSSRNL